MRELVVQRIWVVPAAMLRSPSASLTHEPSWKASKENMWSGPSPEPSHSPPKSERSRVRTSVQSVSAVSTYRSKLMSMSQAAGSRSRTQSMTSSVPSANHESEWKKCRFPSRWAVSSAKYGNWSCRSVRLSSIGVLPFAKTVELLTAVQLVPSSCAVRSADGERDQL